MMPNVSTYSRTTFACKTPLFMMLVATVGTRSHLQIMFRYRCPSGTDGKQCETAPERCIGNPCMHDGKCQDFGSGLNCSCSRDFTGIGCQYEFDACQADVCQNGATCMDNGVGYTCVCAAGFTGKNCEEDIIDCKENSCPPTATCVDLTNKFYCQCPFNLTGDDCRKSKSVFSTLRGVT